MRNALSGMTASAWEALQLQQLCHDQQMVALLLALLSLEPS